MLSRSSSTEDGHVVKILEKLYHHAVTTFIVHLWKVTFWPENSYRGSAWGILKGDVGRGGGEGADRQDEDVEFCHPICKEPINWVLRCLV